MPNARFAIFAFSTMVLGATSIGVGCGAEGGGEAVGRAGAELSSGVVISALYGAGGNTGATWQYDFVELFNRGTTSVSLSGMSLQYASSGGTSWSKHALANTTLAPGQHWLVQLQGGSAGSALPLTADESGTEINMAAASGKLALVKNTTTITCTACATDANVIDFVGFGSANDSETAPTAALSVTTAAVRGGGGCTETDDNATDFTVETAASGLVHNSSSTLTPCSGVDGGADTSAPDTAADTGAVDTGVADTAKPDTATPDTSTPDTATPDTSTPDTATPDTSTPDTATPDTSTPDTGVKPDTGTVDSGHPVIDDPPAAACSCDAPGRDAASPDRLALVLAALGLGWIGRARRRR
jgi:hypothetical protein